MLLNPYRFGVSAAYWSTTDKNAGMAVSSDTKSTWRTAAVSSHLLTRGVTPRSSGKRYIEFYSPQARGSVPGQGAIAGLVTSTYALDGTNGGPGGSAGGIGAIFRRYISPGNSTYLSRNATDISLGVDPSSSTGWVGFAIDFSSGGKIWINIDGTWLSGLSPSSSPGTGYTSVPAAGDMYPAASTYYPIGTYPDNSVTMRVLASEMSIGASAFNSGQVLDGFLPWGA